MIQERLLLPKDHCLGQNNAPCATTAFNSEAFVREGRTINSRVITLSTFFQQAQRLQIRSQRFVTSLCTGHRNRHVILK